MNLSEKENNNIHQFSEDEIDIVELFGAIWEGKMLIILLTSVVALGSILYSLSLTNYFTSESILSQRSAAIKSTFPTFWHCIYSRNWWSY